MKEEDTYKNIAEYYDYMLKRNPQRKGFFARVFQDNGVKTVLDCACGTGNDLVMFDSLGVKVTVFGRTDILVCSPGSDRNVRPTNIFIKTGTPPFLRDFV